MDVPGTFGVIAGVDTEQNGDGFSPVRTIGLGVEKADVKLQVLHVVVGGRRAPGRFIKKIRRGHDGSPDTSTATSIRSELNFNQVLTGRKLHGAASRDAAETSPRAAQSIFASAPSLRPFKKCDGIDLENGCEFFQHVDGSSMLFALEHADIIAVDLGTISKLLLRQAFG